MSRGFLRSVARFLAGIVLLAQLMVAAYACPSPAQFGVSGDREQVLAVEHTSQAAPMPADCDSMAVPADEVFTNLCAEHCKSGDQSDRAVQLLQLPVASATVWYLLPEPVRPSPPTRRARAAHADALAATQPPHAILHCVRRT